jgi:hypothetical protein
MTGAKKMTQKTVAKKPMKNAWRKQPELHLQSISVAKHIGEWTRADVGTEMPCKGCGEPASLLFTFCGPDSYIPTSPQPFHYACAFRKLLSESIGVWLQ